MGKLDLGLVSAGSNGIEPWADFCLPGFQKSRYISRRLCNDSDSVEPF